MRHTVEITRFPSTGRYEIRIDDVDEVEIKNHAPSTFLQVLMSREKAHALRDELIEMCGVPDGYKLVVDK